MTTLEPRTNLQPSRTLETRCASGPQDGGQRSLTQAVRAAAGAIEEAALRPVARREAGLAFEPRTLLALLSYCYVRDIFGSSEIEGVLRRDVRFRQICNHEFPDAQVIRRFRRQNREALHRCLTAALRSLAGGEYPTVSTAAIETALAEDATRRIMKAMFIDSLEMDGD